MRLDAHYYGILAFARACGFNKEKALLIAYASQYVDDANIDHIMIKGNPGNIKYDLIDNKPSFFNVSTSSFSNSLEAFNCCTMIRNTCAFHFIPGCKGVSFVKKLRCDEKSPIMLGVLNETLGQEDLIKLGVVLHGFLDTFSHQGFSGLLSKVNDIQKCTVLSTTPWFITDKISYILKGLIRADFEKLLDMVVPAYGHAQAGIYPDLPYLSWSYYYDYTERLSGVFKMTVIDNKLRYMDAFHKIKDIFDRYLIRFPEYRDKEVQFKDFDSLFDTLISPGTDKRRINNWIQTMVKGGLFDVSEISGILYDKERWLKEAFQNYNKHLFNSYKVEDAVLKPHFSSSEWYMFYNAVIWYRKLFFENCFKNSLYIPD